MKAFVSIRSLLACASVTLALPMAAAAATAPTHVRGTISAVSASGITVATATGPVVVALSPKTKFAGALPASIDDIKAGTFIGTANVPSGNVARALEVVVFPESMKGAGEGDYPWDLSSGGGHSAMTNGTVAAHAGSSMTNATVDHVSSGGMRTVSVSYKGGTKRIAIPANAPIVRVEPGTPKLLASGAHVFVVAIPNGDKLGAAFVVVGEHGTVPPM